MSSLRPIIAGILMLTLAGCIHAQSSPSSASAESAPSGRSDIPETLSSPDAPDTPDAPKTEDTPDAAALPHVHVDREAGVVDVDARVVLREGEWIELIACSPGTQEHESLVVALGRPSHIHLALLALGAEAGSPMIVETTPDGYQVHPPRGPIVAVSFVVEEDGQSREIPANQWVVDQENDQVMQDNHFLFTGSSLVTYEGETIYMADLNGTVVSLVNFGDDLITRDATATNKNDNQAWNANTAQIPPLGTLVKLRLRPVLAND